MFFFLSFPLLPIVKVIMTRVHASATYYCLNRYWVKKKKIENLKMYSKPEQSKTRRRARRSNVSV